MTRQHTSEHTARKVRLRADSSDGAWPVLCTGMTTFRKDHDPPSCRVVILDRLNRVEDMQAKCPLCGQTLPSAVDEQILHAKLERLTSQATKAALNVEKQKLNEQFENKLAAEKEIARQRAEKEFQRALRAKQDELEKLSKVMDEKIEKARSTATSDAQRLVKRQLDDLNRQVREAKRDRDIEVKKAREEGVKSAAEAARLDKEKAKLEYSREVLKWQDKVTELSRQLEKKSGEQFGEEGEFDLFSMLQIDFPKDRIERVGRGVKGADILHTVMDGDKEAGCIIYESKNVAAWQNAFISQAKKYHTQYETPYVMVVSKVFPSKKRGMCVVDGMPVVEPRFASTLATVMREGILEIAKLRLTGEGADEKAQELYTYVIGNEFQTRFLDMADAVDSLKDLQKSERTWHENQWTKQAKLHSQIENRHREIDAKVQSVVKERVRRRPMVSVSTLK